MTIKNNKIISIIMINPKENVLVFFNVSLILLILPKVLSTIDSYSSKLLCISSII